MMQNFASIKPLHLKMKKPLIYLLIKLVNRSNSKGVDKKNGPKS